MFQDLSMSLGCQFFFLQRLFTYRNGIEAEMQVLIRVTPLRIKYIAQQLLECVI